MPSSFLENYQVKPTVKHKKTQKIDRTLALISQENPFNYEDKSQYFFI